MMSNYPKSLVDELAKYNVKPTRNLEWDRALLKTLQRRAKDDYRAMSGLRNVITELERDKELQSRTYPDLSDPAVYAAHAKLLTIVADDIIIAPQRRKFDIDGQNKDILRFLLYYFNECPLAEEVFPGRGYKLHKNIMLQGGVGVGKTMMMQLFSEYLKRTKNPRFFFNVSVTQMVNHFSIHNNIDLYTYNEEHSVGFQIKPYHLCLNDIGLENRPFYGIDTTTVVSDFLHARNELWANTSENERKYAHLTTNLDIDKLKSTFGSSKDIYGRTVDRFKTYNVIPMTGESRR